MPATDYQRSATAGSFTNITRSFFTVRREQVHSMLSSSLDVELDAFQKLVTDRFLGLFSSGSEELLSLSWVSQLLDTFLCCQEEFRIMLYNNRAYLANQPMDRLLGEYFERSVKALDVCNAVRDGLEQIRRWQKLLEITLIALDSQRSLAEGQFRRAKKALVDLAISMMDERDSAADAHRNRSFGSSSPGGSQRSVGHFRSLSWSVSRSWSAARQLQAIGSNLVAPRQTDVLATNGFAMAVYTMSSVLLFVAWALVAAIPCQDRGLQVHFSIPRQQYAWAAPMLSIHDRILEESKKRDRRNSLGLLKEINQIEKCRRHLTEMLDSIEFPMLGEKEIEMREGVQQLDDLFENLKESLDPLERQVRDVFHKIVRSRTEGLDTLGRASHAE